MTANIKKVLLIIFLALGFLAISQHYQNTAKNHQSEPITLIAERGDGGI